jgi:4a-hydroxytetrahydrobiopterin dehydratase
MADLLSQEEIDVALSTLPGWSYERDRLVRVVDVPEDRRDNLERGVMEVADEMDHHPVISGEGGSMRFEVWSHSAGGVTAKDVDLVARIDQVLSGTVHESE